MTISIEEARAVDVEALRALLKAATSGPWRAYRNTAFWEIMSDDWDQRIADTCASDNMYRGGEVVADHGEANAELIAAAVNALPALLSLAERVPALEEENARLREALAGVDVFFNRPDENSTDAFERVALEFYKSTGYLRPGKDCRLHDFETRQAAWDVWVASRLAYSRAALKGSTP